MLCLPSAPTTQTLLHSKQTGLGAQATPAERLTKAAPYLPALSAVSPGFMSRTAGTGPVFVIALSLAPSKDTVEAHEAFAK